MKPSRPVLIALAVCLVAGGLLGVAAAQNSTGGTPPADADAATPGATPEATPGATPESAEAVAEFTVVMGQPAELVFDPRDLTIPANTDVTINLTNNGALVHNFRIDELVVRSPDLQPGESATVTINAEPGEYEFYCSIEDHRELGMVGTLIVE